MVLCDTNVFIYAFNGDAKTISALQSIGYDNILLSSITVMELYPGMGNKKELQAMKNKIRYYDVIEAGVEIKTAKDLLEKVQEHLQKLRDFFPCGE